MKRNMEKLLLAEQAAEWLIRLESANSQEREEFLNWVKQSPLHVRELIAAQACSVELHRAFRSTRIDAETFAQSARIVHQIGVHENVSHDNSHSTPKDQSAYRNGGSTELPRPRRVMAAAMIVVALLAAAMFTLIQTSDSRIATVAGEWRSELLPDGSIVQLGPRTKLVVEFADDHRVVKLSHGEALFRVAHDSARPFLVDTQLASVRAIGTAFAVSLDNTAQVKVTVQEGVVAVAKRAHAEALRTTATLPDGHSITLKAGEQVAVTSTGTLAAEQVNVEAALAWTKQKLFFERENVGQAVHEFNRLNELQIKILDRQLQDRAVRGVFDATAPEEFAEHLEKLGAVAVKDKHSGTLLITPDPAAGSRKADN